MGSEMCIRDSCVNVPESDPVSAQQRSTLQRARDDDGRLGWGWKHALPGFRLSPERTEGRGFPKTRKHNPPSPAKVTYHLYSKPPQTEFSGCGGFSYNCNIGRRKNTAPKLPQSVLTLRKLKALSSFFPAVFLTFNNTAVAGQEATLFQHVAQRRLVIGERFGNAVTHRAGLTRRA